jgi:cyclopropane-fatty-acyl-phospholipid synthase
MGILSPITDSANALASYAGSYALPPLLSVSRSAILSLLRNIQIGSLSIQDTDGSVTICGSPRRTDSQDTKNVYSAAHTELRVMNDLFWVRLALFADMGFAESYMLGEVACPDITAFFKLFIQNRKYLANGSTFTSDLAGKVAGFIRSTNTLT